MSEAIHQGSIRWFCTVAAAGLALCAGPALGHGAPETDNSPDSRIAATITAAPVIEGLDVMILDAPRPGLLLSYRGEQELTVLGENQEPMLRITERAVKANQDSLTHRLSDQRQKQAQPSGWTTVSESGTYGWMDPRLAVGSGHREEWTIEIVDENGGLFELKGSLEPKPMP
ncbi:hypothetical protein DET50_105147 [Marinobacter pelagius]|uniref:Uncharacterized protein n=1 Tax=Marinobacter pelagius TaxID=379482 RepID=A0A366GYF5_9GAMM|nr:hypothetical protein [Marinobacter pelagius]RBP31919.1 hypothetical protein DET50_105147 [Marinobacter pelagius]